MAWGRTDLVAEHGDWMMLGRVRERIAVVTGVLLPKGDPPLPSPS
jgi:hypothetical protein